MGRSRSHKDETDVVRITGAPHNPADDVARRQRRYVISMSIRTACFVAGVISYRIPWLCITFFAASFLLPFVAVVIANVAAPRIPVDLEGPGVGRGPGHDELSGRSGSSN